MSVNKKDEILWFCKTGDTSSLSRITDSVVPLLVDNNYSITLLSNKTKINGVKNVILGSDCISTTYKEFLSNYKVTENNIRGINLKYILVQIVDLIYEGNFKSLLVCNGIYEVDWITKMLKSNPSFLKNSKGLNTKLIVWSPIDYIPGHKILENVVKADIFITMTPIMVDKIKELYPNVNIDWVGHGSDIYDESIETIDTVEKEVIELHKKGIIKSAIPIKHTDIIILNANNYGPLSKIDPNINTRKRLDITFKAFELLLSKLEEPIKHRVKLWIHTDLDSFFEMLSNENISIKPYINHLIFSRNNLTSKQLSYIYRISKISIQTSHSEGWSLTNMEAALYGSLQIVPDFLACGYHFKNNRGILIPVKEKMIKNEAGYNVIIGEVSVEDTCNKLLIGVNKILNNTSTEIIDNAKEYANSFTWKNITDKLISLL
jgi:hypothetical protein